MGDGMGQKLKHFDINKTARVSAASITAVAALAAAPLIGAMRADAQVAPKTAQIMVTETLGKGVSSSIESVDLLMGDATHLWMVKPGQVVSVKVNDKLEFGFTTVYANQVEITKISVRGPLKVFHQFRGAPLQVVAESGGNKAHGGAKVRSHVGIVNLTINLVKHTPVPTTTVPTTTTTFAQTTTTTQPTGTTTTTG